jgi:hypothetical protein
MILQPTDTHSTWAWFTDRWTFPLTTSPGVVSPWSKETAMVATLALAPMTHKLLREIVKDMDSIAIEWREQASLRIGNTGTLSTYL